MTNVKVVQENEVVLMGWVLVKGREWVVLYHHHHHHHHQQQQQQQQYIQIECVWIDERSGRGDNGVLGDS